MSRRPARHLPVFGISARTLSPVSCWTRSGVKGARICFMDKHSRPPYGDQITLRSPTVVYEFARTKQRPFWDDETTIADARLPSKAIARTSRPAFPAPWTAACHGCQVRLKILTYRLKARSCWQPKAGRARAGCAFFALDRDGCTRLPCRVLKGLGQAEDPPTASWPISSAPFYRASCRAT